MLKIPVWGIVTELIYTTYGRAVSSIIGIMEWGDYMTCRWGFVCQMIDPYSAAGRMHESDSGDWDIERGVAKSGCRSRVEVEICASLTWKIGLYNL